MQSITWPTYVPTVNDYIALGLDSIAWQRRPTATGSYIDLTAAAAAAASLTGTIAQTFSLNGKQLIVVYRGITYTVDFIAADPHTIADVVAACTTDLPAGITPSDALGKLKMSTVGTGTAEILTIGDGDANDILGFTEDQQSVGKDAHVTLVTDQKTYSYVDSSGDPDYYYRYRFVIAATGEYTDWISAGYGYQGSPVTVAKLCRGTIKLMDADGTSFRGQQLLVTNPLSADGVAITGSEYNPLGPRATVETDDNGEAGLWVLRGAVLDISIEGTGLIRRVTIPDQETVDLLDSAISTGDLFEVQTLDIPDAIRRTI